MCRLGSLMIHSDNRPSSTATTCSCAEPNIYASQEFLDVIARVYFPARQCRIEDFALEGGVYRLLSINGQGPVVKQTFLDMHEPLRCSGQHSHQRKLRRLAGASLGIISIDEYKSSAQSEDFFGAPTILWSGFETWEAYLELLRKRRVLGDDQRRKRRIEELLGPLEFTVDDLRDDVLPTCFSWKSARDRDSARPDLFSIEANRSFFYEMRARGLLRASSLRAGGKLLAVWLGAVHQQRWTGWVFAFNGEQSLAKYSLGRQLIHFMLEESFRAGHEEFDFSIGLEPYKLFFATHVRVIASLGMPPIGQRLRGAVKALLGRSPRLCGMARTLNRRLVITFQPRDGS